MPGYKYLNDYEREQTQKYEGAYTSEEIELNKRLYEECYKNNINYEIVEELLKQGADPLGGTEICGWDLLIHIYGEIVADSQDTNSVDLPKLTELFLEYGMDVDKPRVPYDGDNSLNPIWMFTFVTNENAIIALKMLLDNGLSAEGFGEFWGHTMFDLLNIDCGDPENDEFWNKECIWTFKMLFLGATYDHVFNNDTGISEFLCCSYNTTDIHIFRNWDDFEYHFDTSTCERHPELYGSIIRIFSKNTGEEVWKMGVGALGRKALNEMKTNDNLLNNKIKGFK